MTASFGSRSHLWDLTTGQPIGKPQPHAGDVVSIEISANSQLALIADWDGAQVFDTATGRLRYPRLAHEVREDTVLAPSFSADGRTIVTRDTFESIRLWDAETGKPRGERLAHGGFVSQMRFSLDGKRVVSLGDDARVWSVETGQPVGEPLKDFHDIDLHPTSPIVAICGTDGKVRLRELPTGNQIAELAGEKPFQRVSYSGSGVNVVAVREGSALLWIHAGGIVPQQIELPHTGLSAAQFSPDGRYVLTSAPRSLKAWTVGKAGQTWEHNARSSDSRDWLGGYTTVEFSPDSSSVVAISKNQVAEVLSARSGQLLLREQKVHEAAFTGDGRSFFAASDLGWVRWRTILPDESRHLPAIPKFEGDRVMALAFSPDGKLAVVASETQGAQFANASTWELDGKPLPHEWSLKGAAFSPDGRTLVTTSYLSGFGIGPRPDKVLVWDVATRQPIGEPIEHPATTPVFDVTGQTVHLGGSLLDLKTRKVIPLPNYDRRAKSHPVANLFHWINRGWPLLPELRDAKTGELKRIQMPQVSENRAVLTKDGSGLITSHLDGTSRLWNAQTGQPLGPAFRPEGGPSERTPDGRFVVFGDLSTMRIWDPFAGRPCGEPLQNEQANAYAAFSPSGDKLATLWHFTANLWDSATGQSLSPPMLQRSNGGMDVLFSPDGQELIVLCRGVQRYRVPIPAADEPERLQLSVEVRTGLQVTENGTLQKLSQQEWLERMRRLEQLGGPCDVPS